MLIIHQVSMMVTRLHDSVIL